MRVRESVCMCATHYEVGMWVKVIGGVRGQDTLHRHVVIPTSVQDDLLVLVVWLPQYLINNTQPADNFVEAHCYCIGRTGQLLSNHVAVETDRNVRRFDCEGLNILHFYLFPLLHDCSTIAQFRLQTRTQTEVWGQIVLGHFFPKSDYSPEPSCCT